MDLVLSPTGDPPVAKIVDWSKFLYNQKKKQKAAHKSSKAQEMKEMWFKPFIDEGDMMHKLGRVQEFLNKGHKVKLTVRYKRGASWDKMKEVMTRLLEAVSEYAEAEAPPKSEGRNTSVFLKSKKK
jgi:translation initiation factor IF-3